MTDSDKLIKAHETKKKHILRNQYLQPALLSALAALMKWPLTPLPPPPSALHFSGYSAGSYTAIALETDYRPVCRHFQQPCSEGTATVGALGCPVGYLLALLAPHLHPSGTYLASAQRAASHMCGKTSSVSDIRSMTRSWHLSRLQRSKTSLLRC